MRRALSLSRQWFPFGLIEIPFATLVGSVVLRVAAGLPMEKNIKKKRIPFKLGAPVGGASILMEAVMSSSG